MRQYQRVLRTKRKRLELSLELDDYARLKREANRHGMKVATFAREAVFAYLDSQFILPDPDHVQNLELALRQIQHDVHQITHRVGKEKGADHVNIADLSHLLNDLEERITQALRYPEKR